MRIVVWGLLLVSIPAAFAGPAATRPADRKLRVEDLAGFLAGSKGDVRAKIEFRGEGEATWQIVYGGVTLVADLKLVEDKQAGVVRLRVENAVATRTVGELTRDDDGQIRLTVLPEASKLSTQYEPVKLIALRKAKGW